MTDSGAPGDDARSLQARRREERLAAALRANLQRRKLQARARGAEATAPPEPSPEPDPEP